MLATSVLSDMCSGMMILLDTESNFSSNVTGSAAPVPWEEAP